MPVPEEKILKVAAYCRVSTDREDQTNSLDNQKRYFKEYIGKNPNWELYRIYVDEGITGTSTKKRLGFHRMMSDGGQKAFDLLLTKEISRFARNTLDSIFYTRRLKELGIGVIFLNDNINTLDADAELRLTIMSSIAQEESRKISERVTWGQKRRMEQGVVFGRSMLGYDVKAGRITMNEQGAEVVRSIFHRYVNEGKGVHTIAKELSQEGIPTFHQKGGWTDSVVLKILHNEKYAGDLVQRKTYTKSYLSHQKKYNKGEKEFIAIPNHHEAIINRELFEMAGSELKRRQSSKVVNKRHSARYLLSGKIRCGYCNKSFVSRTKTRKDGSIYLAWRCCKAAHPPNERVTERTKKANEENVDIRKEDIRKEDILKEDNRRQRRVLDKAEDCKGRQINNELLLHLLKEIVNRLKFDRVNVISEVKNIIQRVFNEEVGEKASEDLAAKEAFLNEKKHRLVTLFIEERIDKSEFLQYEERLKKELESIKEDRLLRNGKKEREDAIFDKLIEVEGTLNGILNGNDMTEGFLRSILDSIIIYDRNHFLVLLQKVSEGWEAFYMH